MDHFARQFYRALLVLACVSMVAALLAITLNIATRLVDDQLKGVRVLVLESNHDEQMLLDGPYPWPLKQRIQGRHGHLSNRAAAELLQQLAWDGLEAVFLAHLSEENNHPHLAGQVMAHCLGQLEHCRPQIFLGQQAQISPCFFAPASVKEFPLL